MEWLAEALWKPLIDDRLLLVPSCTSLPSDVFRASANLLEEFFSILLEG